jgi:hypothetical protein
MRCSSFEQAITTQCDIAKSALDSYYREANKLISLTSEIAIEAASQAPAPAGGED